ncbi:MAG: DUF2905 domain-containing protein [Bacillota bacterium]
MQGSSDLSRLLVLVGIVIVALGLLVGLIGRFTRLGRLPGDIVYRRGNFTFYFPLATCLLLSGILTLLAWVLRRR